MSLTWSHLDEENVDHYQVLHRSSDEIRLSQIATTQNSSFQEDGLQPEPTYTYRVKAVGYESVLSGRALRSQITIAAAPTITPINPTTEPTLEHAQAQDDRGDGQGQNAVPRVVQSLAGE